MTSSTQAPPAPPAAGGTGRTTIPPVKVGRAQTTFYWMVWPAVIAFFVFHTVPVLVGIFYSFTNYAGYGGWNFVGLSNYANLFKDDRILAAYGFSFLFAIAATILTNAISLAIAMGLNAKIMARNLFRGVYFVPYVLAALVIGYVFQFLFSSSLPKILSGIPLFADNILTNETWAWTAIVALAVWQACAFTIIIYLSGLQTIPRELYEAAIMDGAGPWKRFWAITLPGIMGPLSVALVLRAIEAFKVFDIIYVMTRGGPADTTKTASFFVYQESFTYLRAGSGAAYALTVTLLSGLMIAVYVLMLRRREAAA